MLSRQAHLDLFTSYELPVVNVTAECDCQDFVTPAKACGLPPFALLLHGIAKASMEVENFRHRLFEGQVQRVERLTVSYAVVGAGANLNFSTLPFDEDWPTFLSHYLSDRPKARIATSLRLAPMDHRDYLFVTCLPWLRFTSIQHPIARFADASIPNIAVGRFSTAGGRVTFPISVQAHHGLVDGLHIHQFISSMEAMMARAAQEIGRG